jgi:hypothetical protein
MGFHESLAGRRRPVEVILDLGRRAKPVRWQQQGLQRPTRPQSSLWMATIGR